MSERVFQKSAANTDYRLDGNKVIHCCMRCSQYRFPLCEETEEDIKYPVSGPVGEKCPLPKVEEQD